MFFLQNSAPPSEMWMLDLCLPGRRRSALRAHRLSRNTPWTRPRTSKRSRVAAFTRCMTCLTWQWTSMVALLQKPFSCISDNPKEHCSCCLLKCRGAHHSGFIRCGKQRKTSHGTVMKSSSFYMISCLLLPWTFWLAILSAQIFQPCKVSITVQQITCLNLIVFRHQRAKSKKRAPL